MKMLEDDVSLRLKDELILFTEKKFCEYYYANGIKMETVKNLIKADVEKILNEVLYITKEW